MIDEDLLGAPHLVLHHHHRARFAFGAALAVEFQRVLALRGDDAVEAGEEVRVPESAAEFTVGDRLQAGSFLHGDCLPDLPVLDFPQFFSGYFLALEIVPRLLQFRWTQQAADVVGPEGGS